MTDWSQALQRAIDSGATTVFFPANGAAMPVLGTVHLRGNLRRLIGPRILNDGGNLWVLGVKTEGNSTIARSCAAAGAASSSAASRMAIATGAGKRCSSATTPLFP